MPRMRRARRGNKGVKPEFASKFEGRIWDDAKKRKKKIEYEPSTFDYIRGVRGGFCRSCDNSRVYKRARYTPDFRLGPNFFVEAKGKFDAASRSKIVDFIESRPDVRLVMLFGADNWCTGTHTRRYSDWCKERGIDYAIGESIPEAWFDEALRGAGAQPPSLHRPS